MTATHLRHDPQPSPGTTGSTARDPLDVTGIAVPARATRRHSVSSTRAYEQCPRRYWYAHVAKVPAERHVPVSWRIGSAVHAALEAAYRHRAGNPDAALTDGLPAALAALSRSWAELELPDDDGSPARATGWVIATLERDVLATTSVLGVEEALRDDLTPGHRIIGVADLLLARDHDTVEVVDHKVTRWPATADALVDDLQLNLYGALVRRRWPETTAVRGTLHYPMAPDAVTVTLTDGGMAAARDRVAEIARLASADTALTPLPGRHCDHCPWRPRCPAG